MTKPSPKWVQLKDIYVDFHNRCLLQGREQQDIDGQTLRVLQVLIEHYPHTVSRDVLLNEAWPNLVVSDNSLSQCITNLRRLWGDDTKAPDFIRTVPRQGYQLLAEPRAPSIYGRRRFLDGKIVVLTVAMVVAAWGGWRMWAVDPAPKVLSQQAKGLWDADFTPTQYVTTQPGIESFQRFSPDGHWLAYAQATQNSDYALAIAQLETSSHSVLLEGPGDVYPGDWSPDGRHLLAVRQNDESCELVILMPAQYAKKAYTLFACEYHDLPARLRWVTDDTVYLAHSVANEPRLSRLTLQYQREHDKYQVIEAQQVLGLRPQDLDSSADEARFLLLSERLDSEGHYRLSRYDTHTGMIEELDAQLSPYWGISWFGDTSHYLTGGRLRAANVAEQSRDIYPNTSVILDVDYHPSGKIAISEARVSINLAVLKRGEEQVVDNSRLPLLAASSQVDFLPAFSPSGDRLAFVSSRHGFAKLGLWQMDYPDGRPRLLKKLDEDILPQQLRWSPNGRYLAMADNRHQLYCYDLEREHWQRVTAPEEKAFYPFWIEGALAFNRVAGGKIYLVEVEQCQGSRMLSRGLDHYVLHRFDDGSLLLGAPNTGEVMRQSQGMKPASVAKLDSFETLYVNEQGLYYFLGEGKHSVLMYKSYQKLEEKRLFRAVTANYGNVALQFAVLEGADVIVVPMPGNHQADIVVIENATESSGSEFLFDTEPTK